MFEHVSGRMLRVAFQMPRPGHGASLVGGEGENCRRRNNPRCPPGPLSAAPTAMPSYRENGAQRLSSSGCEMGSTRVGGKQEQARKLAHSDRIARIGDARISYHSALRFLSLKGCGVRRFWALTG